MEMDIRNVPSMVGEEAKARYTEAMGILESTKWPVYIVGPSGSGKSIMAMNLAKAYSQKHNVPAYYAQLSPDQTKTSLILGLRLVKGSLVPVKGMVAEAMTTGGIVVIDEATHTTQEMLLMFNSILDRTSVTSVGDEIVYALDTFRVVFCSNESSYSGNVELPQSFAQRLVAFHYGYPDFEDEVRIARKIAKDEYNGTFDVPRGVAKYITSLAREIRTEAYPLSARNIAIALIRCQIAPKDNVAEDKVDPYFSAGANVESMRRNIAKRVLGAEVDNAMSLVDDDVVGFVTYVSKIGIERFREIVMSAFMYYLCVDGSEINRDEVRNNLASSIL